MRNNAPTILIVEDDERIRGLMRSVLAGAGYATLETGKAATAVSMLASHSPDLMLLDLGLPDRDGQELLTEIRTWSSVPVVVVSARGQEKDKVRALDSGADDYVTKPFGAEELLARIRAALRHGQRMAEGEKSVYNIGGLQVDTEKRIVRVDGREVHLTQIEYKIVTLLCRNAGKVLTHDSLIREVWGPFSNCDTQLLRVNMANIRRKIEKDPAMPEYILTEIGVGYRMAEGQVFRRPPRFEARIARPEAGRPRPLSRLCGRQKPKTGRPPGSIAPAGGLFPLLLRRARHVGGRPALGQGRYPL